MTLPAHINTKKSASYFERNGQVTVRVGVDSNDTAQLAYFQKAGQSNLRVSFDPATGTIESVTSALVVSTLEEKYLLNGDLFELDINNLAMADNSTINITFTTPAAPVKVLATPIVNNSVRARFQILEQPTITANSGTTATPFNFERSKYASDVATIISTHSNTPTGFATANATLTSDGTVICNEVIGTFEKEVRGHILRAATNYSFRLTALSSSMGQVKINFREMT